MLPRRPLLAPVTLIVLSRAPPQGSQPRGYSGPRHSPPAGPLESPHRPTADLELETILRDSPPGLTSILRSSPSGVSLSSSSHSAYGASASTDHERFHQRPPPSPAWHGEDFVRPAHAGEGFAPRPRPADPQRATRQFTTPPPLGSDRADPDSPPLPEEDSKQALSHFRVLQIASASSAYLAQAGHEFPLISKSIMRRFLASGGILQDPSTFPSSAFQQAASILGFHRGGLKFLRVTAEKQKAAGGAQGQRAAEHLQSDTFDYFASRLIDQGAVSFDFNPTAVALGSLPLLPLALLTFFKFHNHTRDSTGGDLLQAANALVLHKHGLFDPSSLPPLRAAFSRAVGAQSDFHTGKVHRAIARAIASASASSHHLFASPAPGAPVMSWPAFSLHVARECADHDQAGEKAERRTVDEITDLLAALEAFTDAFHEAHSAVSSLSGPGSVYGFGSVLPSRHPPCRLVSFPLLPPPLRAPSPPCRHT